MIMVKAVVGVRCAGHNVAAGAGAVGTRCVVLEVRSVSTWIVHKPVVVAEAEASEVAYMVAIAAVIVAVVSAVSVVVCWLVFDDTAGVVEVVAGGLPL